MKQDAILKQYKRIVDAYGAVDVEINALVALLPDAPVKEGEPPSKMVTNDMNKCLYVAATFQEDARLRIGAVFNDMLRYSDEFIEQQQKMQAEALAYKATAEAALKNAKLAGDMPTPDFTPKEAPDAKE